MLKRVFLLLLIFFVSSNSFCLEKISSFHSSMKVDIDASAVLTEDITIQAEQSIFKHGIFRTIPLSSQQKIQIQSVSLDGNSVPFQASIKGTNYYIKVGDPSSLLPKGTHSYRIVYTFSNAVRFFARYDEIYWNVTGHNWQVTIDKAQFTLQLPQEAAPLWPHIASYVGPAGTKGTPSSQNGLEFVAPSPIYPGDDFTVAVPFKKGIIKREFSYRNLIPLALLFLLGIYYWLTWHFFGKDPQARVQRRFTPPDLSPLKAHFLFTMGKSCSLNVFFLSMIMKNVVQIKKEKGEIQIVPVFPKEDPSLSEEESAGFSAAFPGFKTLKTNNRKDALLLLDAKQTMYNSLTKQCKPLLTRNETLATWARLLLCGIILYVAIIYLKSETYFYLFVCVLPLCYIIGLILTARERSGKWWNLIACSAVAAFYCLAWLMIKGSSFFSYRDIPILFLLMIVSVIAGAFEYWIKKYTIRGRALMDQIEGFRQYLAVGEEERIQQTNPTDAKKLFCDYLPYAVALDMENEWADSFESVLSEQERLAALSERGLDGIDNFDNFASAFPGMDSFSSDSSDGADFGGSSGGGDGGGGGGGW